ncbi:MAG: RNA polymerase sigma factor [Bacteroidetes bacterium]|nr:RNA polymerase sigma factor [Bacteroidota bacterium]
MTETEIIKGCIKHDRQAQKLFYELFYQKMMAVCIRYTKNSEEAKDILHEGFIKVLNSLKSFSSQGSFEGWVRRIVVNTAVDALRKNKQEYLIVSTVNANKMGENIAEEETSEDDLLNSISTQQILVALQELTPAYRTVFNLFVIEGYSHKEISDLLGISEGTSKSNLSKAKFNLRKNLTHLIQVSNGN